MVPSTAGAIGVTETSAYQPACAYGSDREATGDVGVVDLDDVHAAGMVLAVRRQRRASGDQVRQPGVHIGLVRLVPVAGSVVERVAVTAVHDEPHLAERSL